MNNEERRQALLQRLYKETFGSTSYSFRLRPLLHFVDTLPTFEVPYVKLGSTADPENHGRLAVRLYARTVPFDTYTFAAPRLRAIADILEEAEREGVTG